MISIKAREFDTCSYKQTHDNLKKKLSSAYFKFTYIHKVKEQINSQHWIIRSVV